MFEAFVNLGYIWFKFGDLEKVAKANLRAVEVEPRYARGYANLGFAYLQMGKADEAIDALNKALELNPDIIQAWCNLANAYLQKGDIDHSIETNEKMLKIAPDFALGYNNLANAYFMKDEFEKAVRHCDKAIELGFEVHPEFLKLLEPHRGKTRKKSTDDEEESVPERAEVNRDQIKNMIENLFSQYSTIARKADLLFKTIQEKYPDEREMQGPLL